jgi:hypothetical protein
MFSLIIIDYYELESTTTVFINFSNIIKAGGITTVREIFNLATCVLQVTTQQTSLFFSYWTLLLDIGGGCSMCRCFSICIETNWFQSLNVKRWTCTWYYNIVVSSDCMYILLLKSAKFCGPLIRSFFLSKKFQCADLIKKPQVAITFCFIHIILILKNQMTNFNLY